MKNRDKITKWDDDFKHRYWTPHEIAASQEEVLRIGEIIEAERNGYITQEEALMRHLMLDPDLAEILHEDANEDGSDEAIERVEDIVRESKNRMIESFAVV